MRRAYLLVLMLLVSVMTTGASDWQLVKIGGRDHVTLDNVAEFYGFAGVQRVNNEFGLRATGKSLRGKAGSVEFLINGLKFNLSYPVAEHDGQLCISRMDLTKVIEPVLRPSKIRGADKVDTIVLDPGHGGHANGAVSPYGYEKTFALDVAQRARLLLEQAGFKVVMTRSSDVFLSLSERTAIANQQKNALFISIHFNSGGSGTGLETYTLAPRGVPSMMSDGPRVSDLDPCPGHACDPQNIALATATHAALVVKSKMFDRGIKRARFVVIRDIQIPGVLIEGGFMSNSYDAKLIAQPSYRQTMASCILQAVQNYRRAVGTQMVELAARPVEGPTVQTPTALSTDAAPSAPAEPTVITPTASSPN